jgi:hypothetical protein
MEQEEYLVNEIVYRNNIVYNIVSTYLEYIRNTEGRKDNKKVRHFRLVNMHFFLDLSFYRKDQGHSVKINFLAILRFLYFFLFIFA